MHRTFIIVIVAAASFAGATSSRADQSIGGAEIVINEVTGNLASGSPVSVIQGDSVYRDELVRTNTESKAKFVLLDSTNLTIGPSSTIKLDRFIYAGAERPGAIALRFTKGALLFVTGDAKKRAYSIITPTAAIGVRGTILKIASYPSKTIVDLVEGAATVCTRLSAHRRCVDLTRPNQVAVATTAQVAVGEGPSNDEGLTGLDSIGTASNSSGGAVGGRGGGTSSSGNSAGGGATGGGATGGGSGGAVGGGASSGGNSAGGVATAGGGSTGGGATGGGAVGGRGGGQGGGTGGGQGGGGTGGGGTGNGGQGGGGTSGGIGNGQGNGMGKGVGEQGNNGHGHAGQGHGASAGHGR